MRILSTFGELPGTWLNLFLVVISGTVEGIGITLFIPLLHMMNGQLAEDMPFVFSQIIEILGKFGIGGTPISLLVFIAGLVLGSLLLVYIQRRELIKSKELFTRNLRNKYVTSLLQASWQRSSERSHGEAVNEIVTESGRAGNALGFELMAVASAIQIGLYVLFSLTVSWPLMLIAAGFGMVSIFIFRPFNQRAKQLGEMTSETNRDLSFYCLEYLRILKLAKATSSTQRVKDEIANRNQAVFDVACKSQMNTTQVTVIVQALPVILLTGLLGISHQVMQVSVPVTLVFLLFMMRIAPRIGVLQQQIQTYNQRCHALGVVRAAIEKSESAAENINQKGIKFKGYQKQISLNGVSFEFPDSDSPAVDNVSMTFEKNQIIAIVGASGAGKSTLMDIITGIRIPDSGSVTIDGKNLTSLNLASWRDKIGIVTQETTTLNATLRENLTFFNPTANEEDIAEVISISHLEEVLNNLPNGMETFLGEGGTKFSGGQKQRIALARALLRKPELLLLDEATSALDNESENNIQKAIEAVSNKMTIVIIAHRLSTVRRAEKIYVMEKGSVKEKGTFDDLMRKGGLFARLRNFEIR